MQNYQGLLELGMPSEVARIVLPIGTKVNPPIWQQYA